MACQRGGASTKGAGYRAEASQYNSNKRNTNIEKTGCLFSIKA